MSEEFIQIEAYHTCHFKGTQKDIFNNSPYCSDPDKKQWLGNGYYFWTDHDLFAHAWGKQTEKYPKGYAITQYIIEIPRNMLLDLVGNVKDQLMFREQILKYARKMGVELNNKQQALQIPISKVLDHLRLAQHLDEANNFSYSVIKAVDYSSTHSYSYPFIEGKHEKIVIPSRQQIYLQDICFLKTKKMHCLYRLDQGKHQKYTEISVQINDVHRY